MHASADNTDLEACRDRKVRVIQATTSNIRANAEYLLASMMLLFRPGIVSAVAGDRQADIRLGRELNGSVVGIFGLAPTAHTLALMLRGLGAKLIGYDPAVHHTAPIWSRLQVQAVSAQGVDGPRRRGNRAGAVRIALRRLHQRQDAGALQAGPGVGGPQPLPAVRSPGAGAGADRRAHQACMLDGVGPGFRRCGHAIAWNEEPVSHAAPGFQHARSAAAGQLVRGPPRSRNAGLAAAGVDNVASEPVRAGRRLRPARPPRHRASSSGSGR